MATPQLYSNIHGLTGGLGHYLVDSSANLERFYAQQQASVDPRWLSGSGTAIASSSMSWPVEYVPGMSYHYEHNRKVDGPEYSKEEFKALPNEPLVKHILPGAVSLTKDQAKARVAAYLK